MPPAPECGTFGPGLSTVSVDRVDWLAQLAKGDRGSDLLLGSNEHIASGLLHEPRTTEELVRNRREDWQLSAAHRRYVRTRLVRAGVVRSAAQPGKGANGG